MLDMPSIGKPYLLLMLFTLKGLMNKLGYNMISRGGKCMSYNPWFTNKKIEDEQVQCSICQGWDKYIYEVRDKKTKREIKICFQCYHKSFQQELFDDIN